MQEVQLVPEYETRAPIPSIAVDLGSPSPPPFSYLIETFPMSFYITFAQRIPQQHNKHVWLNGKRIRL